MSSEKYDVLIIGGGIVGLATALGIKGVQPSLKVCLLEKENRLAAHQTGNNSGVIHSGIYYRPGSLKASNCIDGYRRLLHFCDVEGIDYELCGKLIVATLPQELPRLESLYERGLKNGLRDIRKIGAEEIRDLEPHAAGLGAIVVPYTGIVDFKAVCAGYAEIFTDRYNGEIFLSRKVTDIRIKTPYSEVITEAGAYRSRLVVNTAGLYCDRIASLTSRNLDVRIIPFRGEYYEVKDTKRHLIRNLIYPVPDPSFPFLGVHFTRRVTGEIEAGPNAVFAFSREGYKKSDISIAELVESLAWKGFRKLAAKYWQMGLAEYWRSCNKSAFTRALQRLLPEIRKEDLAEGGAGVRAQACGRNGALIDDFLILESPGCVHVLNAPSPAATSSLAIGKTIADIVKKRL